MDSVAVIDPLERTIDNKIEAREQFLVHEFREKFHLVRAMLANIDNQIFHQLLREIHVAVQVAECHLWLNHPKFARVPRRVRVLGAKRWAKSVHFRQRASERFGFELAAHG